MSAIALRAPAAEKAKRVDVTIKSMQFNPASISIHTGDTVVWTNNDDRDHSVVAGDGTFRSGNIGGGESFEHKFATAGTFAYTCGYHPRMKGTVTVKSE
jgi:plastocyanin